MCEMWLLVGIFAFYLAVVTLVDVSQQLKKQKAYLFSPSRTRISCVAEIRVYYFNVYAFAKPR